MKIFRSRAAVSLAALAALTMTATPALARDHWRDNWRYRHHRGDGIDGGDLLAGALIIGGIAAIASAANKSKQQSDSAPYRYPGGPEAGASDDGGYAAPQDDAGDVGAQDYREDPAPAEDATDNTRARSRFDEAVDACAAEVEQDGRAVDSVDSVRRIGERLSVEGRLGDGHDFACSVDDTGHVRSVSVDGRAMI